MNQPSIRVLESRDIQLILAIQAASPEIAQWTAQDYERVAQGGMAGWVSSESISGDPAEGRQERRERESLFDVNGFLVARRVAADVEILNFAVRLEARCCGTGAALLKSALHWARTFSAEQAILEVRSANQNALRFYQRHNFQIVGRRPNYYVSPTDDALLLTARLT